MNFFPKDRLEKYLWVQFFGTFVFTLFVVSLVLLGLQGLRLSNMIVEFDLEFPYIIRMFSALGISLTTYVIPIASLFSFLLLFGRMDADREILAIMSMARSPSVILRTCLKMGFIVLVFGLASSLYFGPKGTQWFDRTANSAMKRRVFSLLRGGTFVENALDMMIYAEKVSSDQDLQNVFVHDDKSFDQPVSISAQSGKWTFSSSMGTGELSLKNGVIYSMSPSSDSVRRLKFDQYSYFANFGVKDWMGRSAPPGQTWWGLKELKAKAIADPKNVKPRKIFIEMSRRFLLPFLGLLIIPLALALNLGGGRKVKSHAVLYGIGLVLVYWTLHFAMLGLLDHKIFSGYKTWLEPVIWAIIWVPNIFYILVGSVWLKIRIQNPARVK